MTPARLDTLRIIARNCHATADQITGPVAEQLHAAGDAITEVLAEVEPPPNRAIREVWVFGAFPSGHHLYTSGRHRPGRETWDVERTLDSAANLPREQQVEGQIAPRSVPVTPGWSFVSWWDRRGDARHGSHTGILARGEWTDAELVEAGRQLAPWAFRVAVSVEG